MATTLTYEYSSAKGGYVVTGYSGAIDPDGIVVIPKTYNNGSNGEKPVLGLKDTSFTSLPQYLKIYFYCTFLPDYSGKNSFAKASNISSLEIDFYYYEGVPDSYTTWGKDCVVRHHYMAMPYTDMDFIGFTFDGKHSYLDLGVLRVINDRIQHSLAPDLKDLTTENPGGDGMYFFGTQHKSRKFNIDFAFDHLTEQQLHDWKTFCSNRELSDLIFDEEPYKVYTAKITSAPSLKTIAFDENGQRIYKGEGSIEFTCYWPYAHTPDANTKVSTRFRSSGKFLGDGKNISSYPIFLYPNLNEWKDTSLITTHENGKNNGDIPSHFVLKIPNVTGKVAYETRTLKVGTLEVVIKAYSKSLNAADASTPYTHYQEVEWDSKTGIVSALISSVRKPIAYTGSSLGTIPTGSTAVTWGVKNGTAALTDGSCTLTYHYWYY